MCIIADEIISVSDTKIFVAPDVSGKRQYVCYSNSVSNVVEHNVMILPVPNPGTLQFVDLTNYEDFFDECDQHFHDPNPSFSDNFLGFSTNGNTLQVMNVGSYVVSVAKCFDDLMRVDKSVFVLNNELIDVLKKYYSRPFWGFIVCKLKKGSEKYHPLAYSHDIYNGRIFIPTRHYHAETNIGRADFLSNPKYSNYFLGTKPYDVTGYNSSSSFDTFGTFSTFESDDKKVYKEIADDWSHDIYLYNIDSRPNPNIQKMNSCKYVWDNRFNLDRKKMRFDMGRCNSFEKIIIKGTHPNMDIILPVATNCIV